jgi:exosortase
VSTSSVYKVFAGLCIASVAVWWKPLVDTFTLATANDAYTHILLVIPISTTLIVLKYTKERWEPSPSMRGGSVLLLLAALTGFIGLKARADIMTGDVRLALEMLGLTTWWVGSFVFCFGGRIFRSCAFPLLFLLWLVPMPEMVVNRTVEFLQQSTASLTREMFALVGVPVSQSGTSVTIPGLTVEVARECSSIRSSLMLVVIAMVTSYLLLRSFWGRTIIFLAAIPLAIAKNALRVFTLAALGAYVDPAILNSPLHHQGGILFLAIALLVLFGVVRLVGRLERRGRNQGGRAKSPRLSASVTQ